jgi:cytochrome oxidase Cu insertion factor (SCO1/SenC/PrrC family)
VTSPEVARVLRVVGGSNDDDTQKFLREVLAKNPDHKIQAQACKALAAGLEKAAQIMDPVKSNPDLRTMAEKQQGKEAVEKGIAEADRKRKEAEELTRTLSEKYGDVFTVVAVGKPAPEIEGEDADGKKFKLSDYRGKVVLLDFWGNW